jgi:phenylacetate-coenzyme A ligase PaaK-like adenylate-forming protein
VIGFGLGTTQAGLMHLKASWEAAGKYKNVTVISPNTDAEMAVFLMNRMYQYYEQIICIGYPPIISDFIEKAIEKKYDIHRWNMKIVYAGENPSVNWRNDTVKKIGANYKDIVSFYGSTEAGMIGFETVEINSIVNACVNNENFRKELLGTANLPTLVSVDYSKKFIEIENNEVLISTDQPIPLIRYNLHDIGALIPLSNVQSCLAKHNISHAKRNPDQMILAIYGRNTKKVFTIEDIRSALERFILSKIIDKEFQFTDKYIDTTTVEVTVVCYPAGSGINQKMKGIIHDNIRQELRKAGRIPLNHKIKINLKVKYSSEKKGYLLGKTRYLLE